MIILKLCWNKVASYYNRLLNDMRFRGTSKLKYAYSEFIFLIFRLLTKIIRDSEKRKLNYSAIKKYYGMYGKEDTMKKYKLSEQLLEEILSA